MIKQKIIKNSKIFHRLLGWFLVMALIPLIFYGYMNFNHTIGTVKKEVINTLISVADNKVLQIRAYFIEREKNVTSLAHSLTIINALKKSKIALESDRTVSLNHWLASLRYNSIEEEFGKSLTYYKESAGYYDLFLISPEGNVVFTVAKEDDLGTNLITGTYKDSELAQVFRRAKTLLETNMSDYKYYSPSGEPAAFIASPVLDEGKLIGVVALQIDNNEISGIVNDYTGLGKTGETVVASREGNEVVLVMPLRHDAHSAFRRKVEIGSEKALPIQEAINGQKGNGLSVDYRGKEILAVWRYLPHLRWGVVVKIDTKEAFAPAARLRKWSLIFCIGIIIGLAVVVPLVSNSISRPITQLTESTKIIGRGDLMHKVSIESRDEIGQLANSFNEMTVKLKDSYLTQERTNASLKREITERKLIDENLKNAMEDLQRSNNELEQFAYVASHDLQEPLRMVASYVQLLQRRYKDKLDDDANEFIAYAVDGAKRMQGLINDLLAYSRVGSQGKDFVPVDCETVLDRVVGNLEASIKESGAVVTHESMPTVMADSSQIVQLFQNLIGNAVKYRNEDIPRVHISAKENGKDMIFSVNDNGIGIDPQYNERIFTIFQRLHGKDEFSGTGIGLAICKKIVERHGGKIWVESIPGKGATFYFTIPKKGVI